MYVSWLRGSRRTQSFSTASLIVTRHQSPVHDVRAPAAATSSGQKAWQVAVPHDSTMHPAGGSTGTQAPAWQRVHGSEHTLAPQLASRASPVGSTGPSVAGSSAYPTRQPAAARITSHVTEPRTGA